MDEILEIIKNNNKACRDLIFVYPHLESSIKLYKKSTENEVIKEKLIQILSLIKEDDEFIKVISKSKSINKVKPVDVRGSVYRINADSDDFKKLIEHANENNWRYNTFSVLQEEKKWLIFFG
jgi:hypothetical protein